MRLFLQVFASFFLLLYMVILVFAPFIPVKPRGEGEKLAQDLGQYIAYLIITSSFFVALTFIWGCR